MSKAKAVVTVAILLASVYATGCTGGKDDFGRDMVAVKGKVTVNGEPVKADKNLFLVFEKVGQRPESVEVNSDGTFSGEAPMGATQVGLQVYGSPASLGAVKPGYLKGEKLPVTVEGGKEMSIELGK